MKIAKISVTPETIDDVLANTILSAPTDQPKVTLKSTKDEILEKLKILKAGLKGINKRYVLTDYTRVGLMAENDPTAQACFTVFNSKAELEKQFSVKQNKNIWARYIFPNPISPETQLRYESFFSGFLHYYDTELRNGMSDHTMYCRWQKLVIKRVTQDVVTVYLDPAPLRHPLKPIPNTKRSTQTPDDYVKLMDAKNKVLKETIYKAGWTPPSIDGFQSDPPTPNGPPPPHA